MLLKTVEHVQNLLKQNEKFIDKDGNIFTQNILEAIEKIDRDLVKLLLSDEKIREQFFIKIDDVFVLEQNKLIEFFTMNEYFNNSFTSYTNKIGLIKKDSFIKKFDDVVLAWPHKDCVLEGGQSKDDEKNNEVFYNEILSRDEIDRLFEPKALTNIKRYTKDGVEENSQINEDDNLIIKGNNLIALHSLKKKYARKVKLIYIDPPYNTGNDSFKYNDRFNHSTWLTFMKNRLEVAREFLSDDGAIFIQCDYNESHYLKVLMDEIFSVPNFRNEIIWKRSQNISSINDVFKRAHDTILFYSNSNSFELTRLFREHEESYLKQYDKYDRIGQYRHVPLLVSGKRTGVTGKIWRGIDPNIHGKNGMHWLTTHEKLEKLDSEGLIYWPKNGGQPMRKYYLNDSDGRQVDSIWNDIKLVTPSSKEGLGFIGQKPEELLQRIIEASTTITDLIMDFHLGSGTTCAVAHKMGRRYIGIEQMDYIEDIAVERMKKVLDGEQGGISKAIEWKGGGSFIYAELKQIENFKDAEIGKLNKNMQYLPVSEMQDADYDMSDDEIKINKKFYELENE